MKLLVIFLLGAVCTQARSVQSASDQSLRSKADAPIVTVVAVQQLATLATSVHQKLVSQPETQPNVRMFIRNRSNRDWYLGNPSLNADKSKVLRADEVLKAGNYAFHPLEARFFGCLPYFSISPTTDKKEYIIFCFDHPTTYFYANRNRACYFHSDDSNQTPNSNTFDQCYIAMESAAAAYIGADKYDPLNAHPGGWRWVDDDGEEHIMSRSDMSALSTGGSSGNTQPDGLFVEYRVVDHHTKAHGDFIIWETAKQKADYYNDQKSGMEAGDVSYDENHHKDFFENVRIQYVGSNGLIKPEKAPKNDDGDFE